MVVDCDKQREESTALDLVVLDVECQRQWWKHWSCFMSAQSQCLTCLLMVRLCLRLLLVIVGEQNVSKTSSYGEVIFNRFLYTVVALDKWSGSEWSLAVRQRSVSCRAVTWLKPRPHQQKCRGNIVECYKSNYSFDQVECCFLLPFLATKLNVALTKWNGACCFYIAAGVDGVLQDAVLM